MANLAWAAVRGQLSTAFASFLLSLSLSLSIYIYICIYTYLLDVLFKHVLCFFFLIFMFISLLRCLVIISFCAHLMQLSRSALKLSCFEFSYQQPAL